MSSATPTSPATRLFLQQAGRLVTDTWLPRLLLRDSRADSPPEDYLSLALRCLLFEELVSGRILVERHAVELDPRRDWAAYELDIMIHQPATGARAIVEVDSYVFHRRTRHEHHYELRRHRALHHQGVPLLCFAGAEARWHPWRCALEVLAFLTGTWREFAPIHIPHDVLRLARTLAGAPLPEDAAPGAAQPSPTGNSAENQDAEIAEIRRRVRALPVENPPRTSGQRRFRARFPRGDERWWPEEDQWLLHIGPRMTEREALGSLFGRHPTVVARRLAQLRLPSGAETTAEPVTTLPAPATEVTSHD